MLKKMSLLLIILKDIRSLCS